MKIETRKLRSAFTLMELLAVAAIIVLLSALVIGLAGYAQHQTAYNRAKAEMAAIETACESFKADNDRYPTSSLYSVSKLVYGTGASSTFYDWPVYNSSLLYTQLQGSGAGYLANHALRPKPHARQVWPPTCNPYASNTVNSLFKFAAEEELPCFVDPWGTPYFFYSTYPASRTVQSATTTPVSCSGVCFDPATSNYFSGGTSLVKIDITTNQRNQISFDLWSAGADRRTDNPTYTRDDVSNFR